jgi:hypothetical protein
VIGLGAYGLALAERLRWGQNAPNSRKRNGGHLNAKVRGLIFRRLTASRLIVPRRTNSHAAKIIVIRRRQFYSPRVVALSMEVP